MDPFRSPLLRTSRLISLPPGTEMFQFPGFASFRRRMTSVATGRVAPFGHLGITACVPLPRASRSLPRPSSPPCAQASPTCLPSLDHTSRGKQNYAHCFKRVTFLRSVISYKDSSIPRSTMQFRCQTAMTLMARAKGSTIESGWTECVETKRLRDAFPCPLWGRLLAIR